MDRRHEIDSRLVARVAAPLLFLVAVCAPLANEAKLGLNEESLIFWGTGLGAFALGLRFLWPERTFLVRRAAMGIVGAGYGAFAGKLLFAVPGPGPGWRYVLPFVLVGALALFYAATGGRFRDPAPLEPPRYPKPPTYQERRAMLCRITGRNLVAKLEWLFATNPDVRREGELNEDGWGIIRLPRADEGGFDVSVLVAPGDVGVLAGELAYVRFVHDDPDAAASAAFTCVRDLLGPDVRLRERAAGGRPYRASIEMRTPEGWRTVSSTVTITWKLFARRSERTLRNRLLPGRRGTA